MSRRKLREGDGWQIVVPTRTYRDYETASAGGVLDVRADDYRFIRRWVRLTRIDGELVVIGECGARYDRLAFEGWAEGDSIGSEDVRPDRSVDLVCIAQQLIGNEEIDW